MPSVDQEAIQNNTTRIHCNTRSGRNSGLVGLQ